MPLLDIDLPSEVLKNAMFLFTAVLILFILYLFMSKKRRYAQKIIEIKEASLQVSNLLKDPTKRNIIKTLAKERKYVSAIAAEIGENAPRTRYHLGQLEKARLVASFKLAREMYFTLTKSGEWCLKAIDYYYPNTNLKWLLSRFGILRVKKFIERKIGKKFDENLKENSFE